MTTDLMIQEHEPPSTSLALFAGDPTEPLKAAESLIKYMAEKCEGPAFISNIQGRKYPRVEWWTTVGAAAGLFPREVSSKRIDLGDDSIAYEAVVEIWRGDQMVGRASAICSTNERTWGNRDEYAVKSMAATRATGKAYRIGLSFLAVLAGLQPTPAEEVPEDGFKDDKPRAIQGAPRRSAPKPKPAPNADGDYSGTVTPTGGECAWSSDDGTNKLYRITTSDGEKFGIFVKDDPDSQRRLSLLKEAREAGKPVRIVWREGKKGPLIQDVSPATKAEPVEGEVMDNEELPF